MDFGIILRYCELIAQRSKMLEVLESDGWTTLGSQGQIVQHPSVRVVADVEAKLVQVEDRLGPNPISRLSLQFGQAKTRSAVEEWLDQ